MPETGTATPSSVYPEMEELMIDPPIRL